jgi:hypothetical protein
MRGVAYTVFQGSDPEPMGVEILGVLHHALGPRQDMILARLTGPKPEYTGVVAGMSGSPVYINGRLVGALAFRIGQFSKEPIAGITPIEWMLEVRDHDEAAAALPSSAPSGDLRPIETPLVFQGFSPQALELWRQHAPGGFEAVAGLGGQASSPSKAPAAPPRPGDAVSALLVEGDLEIAATCTATYVDGGKLLACGHPLMQAGPVSLPMTRAEVVATLPSPLNAFKIVNTGAVIGAWTEDRQTAIGGILGAQARMIPVLIHLSDARGGAGVDVHLRILDQPGLTPSALLVSLFQSLQQSNSSGGEESFRLRADLQVQGSEPVHIEDLLAPRDPGGNAGIDAALEVAGRFSRLYSDPTRRQPISGVEVWAQRIEGRELSEIERVSADRTELHAGEPVELSVTLRPIGAPPELVKLRCVVPASVPAGELRLLVSDGSTLDRLATAGGRGAQPAELAGTVGQLNALHPGNRVYATLLDPAVEVAAEGHLLPELPSSVANAYEAQRGPQGVLVNGESVRELASEAVSTAVSGQQVVTLRIE